MRNILQDYSFNNSNLCAPKESFIEPMKWLSLYSGHDLNALKSSRICVGVKSPNCVYIV